MSLPVASFAQRSQTIYKNDFDNASTKNNVPGTSAVRSAINPMLIDIQQVLDSLNSTNEKHIQKSKLFYNLAVLCARLKLYPLALKCFYQSSGRLVNTKTPFAVTAVNTGFQQNVLSDSSKLISDNIIRTSCGDALYILGDTVLPNNTLSAGASRTINNKDIAQSFDDGKKASAYGIIVHVKQPIPGKRKRFRWFHGVGHTFITLVKFNTDGSSIAHTFGFYPKKIMPLSGTPLFPATPPNFKNDAAHDWDESVGKFISQKQFDLILQLTKRYAHKKYHLNKNNCTDFGLNIAAIAGIYIRNTKGKWPLGGGNDPGDTGQSILEDSVAGTTGSLFICTQTNIQMPKAVVQP